MHERGNEKIAGFKAASRGKSCHDGTVR